MPPGRGEAVVDLTADDDAEVQEVGLGSDVFVAEWAGGRTTRRQNMIRNRRDTHVLSYPPNAADAVTITLGDVERLNEGEFLNDSLVDFMCRLANSYRV